MADVEKTDPFIADLERLVDKHIRSAHDWYSKHSDSPRIGFRMAGLIVVIGSLILPALTAAKDMRYHDAVLLVVSLIVAVVSSVSTFYRWDLMWQTRTKTLNDLGALLAKWELELQASRIADRPTEAALAATRKLFDDALGAVGSETSQFFASVKWPDVPKQRG